MPDFGISYVFKTKIYNKVVIKSTQTTKSQSIFLQTQCQCEICFCFAASMRGKRSIKEVSEPRSSICCALHESATNCMKATRKFGRFHSVV